MLFYPNNVCYYFRLLLLLLLAKGSPTISWYFKE